MLGTTHFMVGVAAALAVTHPATASGCVLGIAAGAIGGVIPDIDQKKLHGDVGFGASTFTTLVRIALVIAAVVALDAVLGMGILQSLSGSLSPVSFGAVAVFAVACIIGIGSGHRKFMHSITCLALLTAALFLAFPNAPVIAIAFGVGFASHVFLDLFNKKEVLLLAPLPKPYACFNVCESRDVRVNRALTLIGLVVSVAFAAWRLVPLVGSSLQVSNNGWFWAYVAGINVLTFVVFTIDYFMTRSGHLSSDVDENDRHTFINLFAVAGGALGMLAALVLWIGVIGTGFQKQNMNWLVIAISLNIVWLVICLTAAGFVSIDGSHVGFGALIGHWPFLAYLAAINIATFIAYVLDRKSHYTKLAPREVFLIVLAIAGGALGALVAMYVTGKKTSSPHFAFGVPVLLAVWSVVSMVVLTAS